LPSPIVVAFALRKAARNASKAGLTPSRKAARNGTTSFYLTNRGFDGEMGALLLRRFLWR